ncbi:MAG TPA: hypothetical protein VN873_13550 [Candidatus Angelobacter sp.]|nr:hypothetical protein [Candidatus Angelobacter sp.]
MSILTSAATEEEKKPVTQLAEPTGTPAAKPTSYEEALSLFNEGDYANAARKLNPDSALHPAAMEHSALLARTYANLGELAKARAWTEQALDTDKLNAGLHYLRATISQEQDALDEAAASLRRALYLDPNFVLAHFALGNLALRQQKLREAHKHFGNVLNLLAQYEANDVVPESGGLAAGRLRELIESTLSIESPA